MKGCVLEKTTPLKVAVRDGGEEKRKEIVDKGAFSLDEIENGVEAKRGHLTRYLLPVPEALRIFGSFHALSNL
jgi:hypothetical protein